MRTRGGGKDACGFFGAVPSRSPRRRDDGVRSRIAGRGPLTSPHGCSRLPILGLSFYQAGAAPRRCRSVASQEDRRVVARRRAVEPGRPAPAPPRSAGPRTPGGSTLRVGRGRPSGAPPSPWRRWRSLPRASGQLPRPRSAPPAGPAVVPAASASPPSPGLPVDAVQARPPIPCSAACKPTGASHGAEGGAGTDASKQLAYGLQTKSKQIQWLRFPFGGAF
jgi:hypothetical protein